MKWRKVPLNSFRILSHFEINRTKETCIAFEECPQEYPYILYWIHGGTSLCILQEDVPLWSCNGNNFAKSESEDIFDGNMLQPSKGKIS